MSSARNSAKISVCFGAWLKALSVKIATFFAIKYETPDCVFATTHSEHFAILKERRPKHHKKKEYYLYYSFFVYFNISRLYVSIKISLPINLLRAAADYISNTADYETMTTILCNICVTLYILNLSKIYRGRAHSPNCLKRGGMLDFTLHFFLTRWSKFVF